MWTPTDSVRQVKTILLFPVRIDGKLHWRVIKKQRYEFRLVKEWERNGCGGGGSQGRWRTIGYEPVK